jgi:glycerophosphoryl diester phosphodiesterase
MMKKYVAGFGLLMFFGLAAAWYTGKLAPLYADYPPRPPLPNIRPNTQPLIMAHRGYSHVAPENTIAAIEAAIAEGLDYVELDVRLTADGVPVLMHDGTIDRTTDGEGAIDTLTFVEIQAVDAGSWFAEEFVGTPVPLLEQALAAAEGNICIVADLKGPVNKRVVDLLKAFALSQPPSCLLVSLVVTDNFEQFREMEMPDDVRKELEGKSEYSRKIFEGQNRVLLRYWPEFPLARPLRSDGTPADMITSFPSIVAIEVSASLASPALIDVAHNNGLLTYMRVVKEEDHVYQNALNAGVDGLFIDDIEKLRSFLSDYAAATTGPRESVNVPE